MGLTFTTESDLAVDTSEAPWMGIALAEEKKGVVEAANSCLQVFGLQVEERAGLPVALSNQARNAVSDNVRLTRLAVDSHSLYVPSRH